MYLRTSGLNTKSVPNYAELELSVQAEKAVAYLHQRMKVLKLRKVQNISLLEGLRDCIFTHQMYTKIREQSNDEESDLIDLTKDLPNFTKESTTTAQLERVTIQVFSVLALLREINIKNNLETKILQTFMSQIECSSLDLGLRGAMLQDHEKAKKLFRQEHTMEKCGLGIAEGPTVPQIVQEEKFKENFTKVYELLRKDPLIGQRMSLVPLKFLNITKRTASEIMSGVQMRKKYSELKSYINNTLTPLWRK